MLAAIAAAVGCFDDVAEACQWLRQNGREPTEAIARAMWRLTTP